MIQRILCAALACAVPMTMSLPVLAAEQKGMLLHYSFNTMDNSGVVRDESGNGNDGTIAGDAVEEYGRIHLDGVDDYIRMPDALLENEKEVTIAVNLCPEFDTLHYFTWNFGISATEGYMFLNTSRPDAKLRFAITPASADKEQSLVSEEDIKKGTWSNVIVTIKGKEGVMYRDGVKVDETTFDTAPSELGATTQNWIGRSPYGDALMQGYIDDFRIYNYALSEDEAKALSDEYEAELNDGIALALSESGIKNIITEDITLPTEAAGAEIRWSISNEDVISPDGRVTRPKDGEYAAAVTLTAEIIKESGTETKTFNVSVPPEGSGIYGLNITGEKGAEINPDMVGLFFEDINYAADGGLYAEMVENRSFEARYADNKTFDPQYDGGWAWSAYPEDKTGAVMSYATESPLNENNPHYMQFTPSAAQTGFANAAYDGLALRKDMTYHGSFYARTKDYSGAVTISAVKDGNTVASASVEKLTDEWTKYSFDMTAAADARGAELVITLDGSGTVDFDMISLMPEDAIDGVFRKDLAEMLKAINPGFLRFPGGCVIEGYNLDNRYQWKDSIGPVEERKENWNRWDLHTDGYNHYNQTLGLGFYEYFELCEYLECEAIPVVNVGMACQFQTNETVSIDSEEFEQYIQDALDLIEFANGDVTTEYGAIRAEMGHPEPFNLTMLGIGNEQWNTEENRFRERYEAFEKAIHEKYPDIKLIGTSGPDVNSAAWRGAWSWIRENEAKNDNFVYAVDEHYYMTPDWFLQNTDFYDNYDRGTYVFAGEYASRTRNLPNDPEANTLYTALTEAAYFTGLERNSDVVRMSCYAPLFARVGYTQWSPDLIWFDDVSVYGSPSYYVQKLNSNNLGDYNVKTTVGEGSNTNGIFTNVSYDESAKELIVKAVNITETKRTLKLDLSGYKATSDKASVTYIGNDDLNISNSIENPERIAEKSDTADADARSVKYDLQPYTFAVIRIPAVSSDIENIFDTSAAIPFIDGYSDEIFAPEGALTRAELMTMLARVAKDYNPENTYISDFTDVPADAWYSNAVGFMEQYGIIEGYPDGTFAPDGIITVTEFNIIAKRLGYSGETGDSIAAETRSDAVYKICIILGRKPSDAGISFTDVPADHAYYGYIAAALGK